MRFAVRYTIITRLLILLASLLTASCTSMYFKTIDNAPVVETRQLAHWPWDEYWTGIVFNGDKIGFSHQQLVNDDGQFRIDSDAALRLRFLVIDKHFAAVTRDWVDATLQLQSFDYRYTIDDSRRKVIGMVTDGLVQFEVIAGEQRDHDTLAFEGELLPMNAIYMYPVLHGLVVGRVYEYQVFDGESLAIHPVTQTVVAFQESELFVDRAFKVETELLGLSTTAWIDANGLPQFELSLSGALISALENRERAEAYLTQAALTKSDQLLGYSLVQPDKAIVNPRQLDSLTVRLRGIPESFALPDTSMQRCVKQDDSWRCHINTRGHSDASSTATNGTALDKHLKPSITVNATAPEIVQLANQVSAGIIDAEQQVTQILDWMKQNIEKNYVDSFNALDVLEQRQAECQGHSLLFAALARSQGIPTRLVNGLVYSDDHAAFAYHTWVESYFDKRWQAIDPSFDQRHADATHIALVEGERLAELTALLPIIGKIDIEIE